MKSAVLILFLALCGQGWAQKPVENAYEKVNVQLSSIKRAIVCKNEIMAKQMHIINMDQQIINAYLDGKPDKELRDMMRESVKFSEELLASKCMQEQTKP